MALVFERGVFLSHKGLNKEIIIKAAADLIETQGRECFSMRLLADSLQVKTASLYNHIKSMDELITAVCEYGLQLQKEMEMDAVKEQHGEQAVRILADTYRLFAKEHRQLYWLIMNTAAKDHQVLDDAAILPVFRRSTRKFPSFSSCHFFISFPASRFFLYLQQIFNALLGLFLLKKFF